MSSSKTFPSRKMMKSSQKFDAKKQQHIYNYQQFEIMGLEKERLLKKNDSYQKKKSMERSQKSKSIPSKKYLTGSTEQSMTTSLNTMSEIRQPDTKGQVSDMGKIFSQSGISSEKVIKQEEFIAPEKNIEKLESLNEPKEKQIPKRIKQKKIPPQKEKITDEQIKQIKVDVQNVPKKATFDATQFQDVLNKIKQMHANKNIQLTKVNQKHSDQIIQAKKPTVIQQTTQQKQAPPHLITKEQQQEFIKKILQKQPVQVHQQAINPQQTSFLVQQLKQRPPQFLQPATYQRPLHVSEILQNPVIQRQQYFRKPLSHHQYIINPMNPSISSYIYQYQRRS